MPERRSGEAYELYREATLFKSLFLKKPRIPKPPVSAAFSSYILEAIGLGASQYT
jgi:hypothetical protein